MWWCLCAHERHVQAEVADMWRVSQGVTKQLTLLKKGFGAIDVEGTLLQDPNREGVGISRFMRTTLV